MINPHCWHSVTVWTKAALLKAFRQLQLFSGYRSCMGSAAPESYCVSTSCR
jgi:hypothetical protein